MADSQLDVRIDIGQIHHRAPTLVELHHAIVRGWIGAIGEPIDGMGVKRGRPLRKGIVVLALDGAAVRIGADVALRILRCLACPASPADEAEQHVLVAIKRGQAGLLVDLGTQSPFDGHEIVDGEVALVVGLLASSGQMSSDPERRFRRGELLTGFNNEGVAALPEPGHQDLLARAGLFERMDEHQQGVCRPGLTAGALQVVAYAGGRYPELRGESGGDPAGGRRETEMADRPGLNRRRRQRPDHRGGHDLEIALVTNPACFPDVVERLVLSPVVVHKVDGLGRMTQQPGGAVAPGNEQRRGAITRGQLQRARGLGAALLGAHHEDRAAATGHRL